MLNPLRVVERLPYWEHAVHTHITYDASTVGVTTLTLFTKDHRRVVTLTDAEHTQLPTVYERHNWHIIQSRQFRDDMKYLYTGLAI